eukprot:m51a1_g2576 hypothetical protein (199) ;mRNA; r:387555-388219
MATETTTTTPSFWDIVATRHSSRSFQADKPVPDATLERIMEAARSAPTAGNMQAWRAVALRGPAPPEGWGLYGHHTHHSTSWVDSAPLILAFVALRAKSAERYASRGERLYALQDATIAATHAMLAAHAEGLGCCWIGAFNEERAEQLAMVPAGDAERVVALLAVGRAQSDEAPKPRKRRALEECYKVVTASEVFGTH